MARPVPRFHNFVGHKSVVNLLRRQLAGATARQEPNPHCTFCGPSGVGKTLLAEGLATEYGTTLIRATGYETANELASLFTQVKFGDFVFVDEAHRLKPAGQELLYQVIDHWQVPCVRPNRDVKTDESNSGEVVSVHPCTIILATDQPGRLLNALQKRTPIRITLDFYNLRELKEIVDRLATNMNLLISPQAAKLVARVSGGLPRKAKHYLENMRRHFPNSESSQLKAAHVRKFLQAFRIDEKGLDQQEHKYLQHLKAIGVASLQSLALHLGVDQEFVRQQIEPHLRRHDFMLIGPGGRQLTESGLKWIEAGSGQKGSHGKDQSR